MIKQSQFYVMKFMSGYLDKRGYNINLSLEEAREQQLVVALADSQALRTIRKIRYDRFGGKVFDRERVLELGVEKKRAKRRGEWDRVKDINSELDEMLYVPEYVLVTVEKKNHYIYMNKKNGGLWINGMRYRRLLCGAGMARNNTVAFIREDFEEEVKRLLENGWNKGIKITDAKFNAYFALSSSATWELKEIPNVLVVGDCERNAVKRVDWVDGDVIETKDMELGFNFFDGGGIIDIRLARKWAEELEMDYVPGVFVVRGPYVKGCLFTMDIERFKEVRGCSGVVKDLFGNEVSDFQVILTKSMFKLWNAYESFEQYRECCEKFGNHWGIARVSPKEDNDWVTTNYQFIQALDIRDDDIQELCQSTVDWIKGVGGDSAEKAMLFLIGKQADEDVGFEDIGDQVVKVLGLQKDMIHDDFIQSSLVSALNRKIKDAYLGKLLVHGNFSTMIPDPYAMLEWAFGLEVKGLLKSRTDVDEVCRNGEVVKVREESECYSGYWKQRGVSEVCACRSPLTFCSEVVKLFVVEEEIDWYQYIGSGIIYNIWGCDCMLHADSDFDGDIVMTTNDPVFLRCKWYDEKHNLPITYEKKTQEKHVIRQRDLWKADLKSFNSTIGQVTNYSTSFYDMLEKFEDGSREKEEIWRRLKIIRKLQGDAIDKAKGVMVDDFPKDWITLGDDEWMNSVCGNRKPMFFRWRYPKCQKDWDKFVKNLDQYSIVKQGVRACEADGEIGRIWKEEGPLINYGGVMNKVCEHMEKELKVVGKKVGGVDIVGMLKTGIADNPEKIQIIRDCADKYFEARRELKKGLEWGESCNIQQVCKVLRDSVIGSFENEEELANYVVEVCYVQKYRQSKSFAWNVFGEALIENMIKLGDGYCRIPVKDWNGDVEYLWKRYRMKKVKVRGNDGE